MKNNHYEVVAQLLEWAKKVEALNNSGADIWYDLSLYAMSAYMSASFTLSYGYGDSERKAKAEYDNENGFGVDDVENVNALLSELIETEYEKAKKESEDAKKRESTFKSLLAK